MNWIEVSIETTSQAVDAVCAKLISIGIEGMRIEDSLDFQEFIEDKRPPGTTSTNLLSSRKRRLLL